MSKKNPSISKTPGELLSLVKDEGATQKRTKADILLYGALILYFISTLTRIILIFLIASGFLMCWILLKMVKTEKEVEDIT